MENVAAKEINLYTMIHAEPVTADFVNTEERKLLRTIRRWVVLFIVLLILSGLTAFPVQTELHWLMQFEDSIPGFFRYWLFRVNAGVDEMAANYPFLLYGYDWLAYSHIVIALFFTGVYRNPVRNEWVLRIGMLAPEGTQRVSFRVPAPACSYLPSYVGRCGASRSSGHSSIARSAFSEWFRCSSCNGSSEGWAQSQIRGNKSADDQ